MENQETNKIIYDWVSFTSKIHNPVGFINLLGLDKPEIVFQQINGAHGYRQRYYFDSISIHHDGREDMGIWCEMSGQGCRAFETYGNGDFERVFDEILENPDEMNITRLDLAYDDFEGKIDLKQIIEYLEVGNYVSRYKDWELVKNSKGGITINIGSKRSDIYFRIYDKAIERGYTDCRHWVRFEIQLRDDRARNFISSNLPLKDKFFAIINNYLRFVEPNEDDTNKRRWDTALWWLDFLESLNKISLASTPGTEYNFGNLERFVICQAGNSIYTYVRCFGVDKLLDAIKKRGTVLTPKQVNLINKMRVFKGEAIDDTTDNSGVYSEPSAVGIDFCNNQ